MSDGMRIFETVTRELRVMHNEGDLRDLGQVSGDCYWAERGSEQLLKELAATLSKEDLKKLNKWQDYFTHHEATVSEIFYNQGFADGISLIMQSSMWESVRR